MKTNYQLLGPLRGDEYAALEADIKARGVLVPVEKDQEGNILDGHHRVEIAKRLGLPYETVVRPFANERAKRQHIIMLNLARRHLAPWQWGQAFRELLRQKGVRRGRGGNRRPTATVAVGETVRRTAEQLGVPERTARRRLAQADAFDALPAKLQDAVRCDSKTIAQAMVEVRRGRKRTDLKKRAAKAGKKRARVWEVRCGDCLEILPALPEPARLIFADPPYNIGVDYGQGKAADRLDDAAYLTWVEQWLEACRDALSADGSLWVLIGDEYAGEYAVALKRLGLTIRSWIKWYETFGVNCSQNFNRTSRHLFYSVRDRRKFIFDAEAVSRPSDRQAKYADKRAAAGGKVWDDVWGVNPPIPRLQGTSRERLPDAPTQLPLALLQPIVCCASDPGDLVVDPFAGSGTTGEAALKQGRRFIGIERSRRFAKLASLRLEGIS